MTVTRTATICDVSGRPDNTEWYFTTPVILREGTDNSIVTSKVRTFKPVDGVLTVKLEPGPVTVQYGTKAWDVTVPDADGALWDLIATAIAVPPNTSEDLLRSAVEGYLETNPPSADWGALANKPAFVGAGSTAAQARLAIGAGTSSLALGTTGSTAKPGNYQPSAANISDASATGRAVLTGNIFAQLARTPDVLIAGSVTRNSDGAATSAPVVWPDGTPGTYTSITLSTAFPGAVDSYQITYGSPVTATYTQPAVTRDATGAATAVPAIVVS